MDRQLQKKNVLLMILLVLITNGIYIPIWFLNRKDTFNDLNSKCKLSGVFIIFLLVLSLISTVMLISLILIMEAELTLMILTLDPLINWIEVIILLVLAFKVRRILSDPFKTNLLVSATFFFTLFFLQYKINRFLENKEIESSV
jgi:hypothetical protein